MKFRGAIFDLDGTLIDSMHVWKNICTDYLISKGIVPEIDLDKKFKTFSMAQAAEYYKTQYHIKESVEEIISGVNKMAENMYREDITAKIGVYELLCTLRSLGVKMYVATTTDKHLATLVLKNNDLMQFFKGIITCSEVGFNKETPHIYDEALKLLGTDKNETLVFEDALHAVKTAKQGGFYVVGIYEQTFTEKQAEIKKYSDYYVENFLNSNIEKLFMD